MFLFFDVQSRCQEGRCKNSWTIKNLRKFASTSNVIHGLLEDMTLHISFVTPGPFVVEKSMQFTKLPSGIRVVGTACLFKKLPSTNGTKTMEQSFLTVRIG